MKEDERQDAKRSELVRRACDYSSDVFRGRMTEVENVRNRSLIALGLVSASSALLSFDGATSRLAGIMWLPIALLGGAFALAIPPLMSMRIVHPVDLDSFQRAVKQHAPEAVEDSLLDNTICADAMAEALARSTAVFTDNSLRLAAVGLTTLVLPTVFVGLTPLTAVILGLLAGGAILAIVEFWRHATKEATDVEKYRKRRLEQA